MRWPPEMPPLTTEYVSPPLDGCTCPCHTQPGIQHFMACCGVPILGGYTRVPGYRKATPEEVDAFLFGLGPIRMGDKRVFEPIGDEL